MPNQVAPNWVIAQSCGVQLWVSHHFGCVVFINKCLKNTRIKAWYIVSSSASGWFSCRLVVDLPLTSIANIVYCQEELIWNCSSDALGMTMTLDRMYSSTLISRCRDVWSSITPANCTCSLFKSADRWGDPPKESELSSNRPWLLSQVHSDPRPGRGRNEFLTPSSSGWRNLPRYHLFIGRWRSFRLYLTPSCRSPLLDAHILLHNTVFFRFSLIHIREKISIHASRNRVMYLRI